MRIGYYRLDLHNPIFTMDNKTKKGSNSNSAPDDVDNVDKIRDILFGNQMRDVEKRFSSLEKSLASDLASLRSENALQIESLKTYIESEIEILGSKLAAEEKSRIEDADELDAKLKQQIKQIDKKIADLTKSMDKQNRDTNQKILKQTQDLSKELSSQMSEARERMDDYRQQLGSAKVDKQALAEMLNTLALQINSGDDGK